MEDSKNNEIIEINTVNKDNEQPENLFEKKEFKNKKEKKPKKKIKLTKKQIIIISIVSILVVLIVIISLVLGLNKKKPKENKPNLDIIVENDNYRYKNGILIFLDKSGNEIGQYQCKEKDANKCYVAKINLETDTFDRIKNVYKDDKELEGTSKIYYQTYVFINDSDKMFLYNIKNKENELDVNNIKSYNTKDDLVVVEDESNKYGLIQIKEDDFEYLIRCSYDNLGIINTEKQLLVAQDKDKYSILNITGKKLSKNIYANIKSADENYIVAEKAGSYNLYSYDFEELLSDYDFISLHHNLVAVIKNKRLYLYDSKLNKLYEDGVRLENTNYIKKYIYDEKNKLIETLKSYEINLNDNIATIIYGFNTKNINILEGIASSKLNYVSYYDDKLYFYVDDKKDDLIGTYQCKNKNNIISNQDNFDNCTIYNNDDGFSGIYNNEYVFIYDNNVNQNKLYYLYSLKERKIKGIYSDIQILKEAEINENIKLLYTSASYIICKSASGNNIGNYGVLEINSNDVKGKVLFNYKSITKEKDYYIFLNTNKKYSLYSSDFNKLSNDFDYIKLYDKYYVGIDNSKLNVYSYKGNDKILEKDLDILDTNYEIDFTDGFQITINEMVYKFDKDGKEKKEDVGVPVIDDESSQDEETILEP